ncbi:MAG: hypothetical protein ACOX6Q_00060 [Candidatus Dojkabacteria bacterium]|jgi:hypothetical protein
MGKVPNRDTPKGQAVEKKRNHEGWQHRNPSKKQNSEVFVANQQKTETPQRITNG